MVDEDTKKDNDTGIKTLFLDLIGYEKGLLITIIDLYRHPLKVIEHNRSGEHKYVSGNRLLLTSLGIWVFFNTLIIDWNKAVSKWLVSRASLLGNDDIDPQLVSNISSAAADVMEKFIVPASIVYVALSTLIARRLCRAYQLPAKQHLEVMTYSTALYYLVMNFFSIVFAINGLIAEALLITAGIINWTGYKNYLELVRTRHFFNQHGTEIERKYKIAKGLATVILTLVTLAIIILYQVLR